MLERIVSASIANKGLVVAIVAVMFVALGRGAVDLPIDAVPDITNVQVQVFTRTAPMGAADVERYVTYPIELALTGIPKVTEMRSISRFGISSVTVVFEEGTDLYWARQVIGERLGAAAEGIPEGFGTPEMLPPTTGLGEIYMFTVSSPDKSVSPMSLREKVDWDIVPRLRSVPGVVEVAVQGGYVKQFQVVLDPRRLVSYGIGVSDVLDALEANNAVAGGGYVEHGGEAYLISANGLVATLEELETVVVATRENTPITVGHLGTVRYGALPRVGAATAEGEGETIIGTVQMLVGENARAVSARIDEEVKKIEKTLPAGVALLTFYDRGSFVDRVIGTVAKNLIEGGALVILVLILLLGNLRAGLVVASVIPLSMVVAATVMSKVGISGNLMSLGALDFGLIVDGAVVMVEHMVRRSSEARDAGLDPQASMAAAAREVARPVAFGVGIICLVYLPILTLTGVEGKMFKPMAYTVLFALVASLVLSLTLAPALTALVLRRGAKLKPTLVFRGALRAYGPLLRAAVARPRTVVVAALVAFAASVVGAATLGSEFVPRLDEGDMALQLIRLPSVALEESIRTSTTAEQVLRTFPEVKHVVSRTGTAEGSTDVMGMEITDMFIILKPPEEWTPGRTKASLVAEMETALEASLPGVALSFTQPIEMRFNELIAGVRSDVAVKVFGDDLDALRAISTRVASVLSGVAGAADVRVESPVDTNSVSVSVDRARIARYSVAAEDVLAAVETAGTGRRVGSVLEGKRRFDLVARLDPHAGGTGAGSDLMEVARVPVATARGALVPVGELAKVVLGFGPAQISHESASRRVVVECNVRGRDLGGFIEAAQVAIAAIKLPEGYYLRWGGQFENLARARARLTLAVPLALGLIFMMLFMAFGALKPALLIYLNVPMAATGGIAALVIRGMPFSISAGVGFIALFGVAVLNGLVLVEHIRHLEAKGMSAAEAAVQGALDRLRPVLMTALVASLGFVPMAISSGAGAEVQRPLATVVIGGILTSTFLTLLVLPALYAWMGRRRDGGAAAVRVVPPPAPPGADVALDVARD